MRNAEPSLSDCGRFWPLAALIRKQRELSRRILFKRCIPHTVLPVLERWFACEPNAGNDVSPDGSRGLQGVEITGSLPAWAVPASGWLWDCGSWNFPAAGRGRCPASPHSQEVAPCFSAGRGEARRSEAAIEAFGSRRQERVAVLLRAKCKSESHCQRPFPMG